MLSNTESNLIESLAVEARNYCPFFFLVSFIVLEVVEIFVLSEEKI